jgi:hypothetical protein
MVRIRLSTLDDAVKAFLAPAQQGETIVIEDEQGRVQCGITPFVQTSPEETRNALAALGGLQQKSVQVMTQLGVTEADLDRELQN